MNTRTRVLPTIVGIALMAYGCGTDPVSPPPPPPPPPPPVASPSVDITPRISTLTRGMHQGLFVALTGFGADYTDRSAIWTSSNPNVVELSRTTVNGPSSTAIPSVVAYAAGTGSATITVW